MFRPLILIGVFLVGIAILSVLLVPGFLGTTSGIVIFALCLGIGIFAVAKDLRDFWHELKAKQQQNGDASIGGDDAPKI